jgi:hypothetical protein
MKQSPAKPRPREYGPAYYRYYEREINRARRLRAVSYIFLSLLAIATAFVVHMALTK